MMGYDFAVLVNDYMESIGHEKRSIAKIATNPEKSKHLETATMVVLDMPLDFVNLRSEVYDDVSRIPSEIVRCFCLFMTRRTWRAGSNKVQH